MSFIYRNTEIVDLKTIKKLTLVADKGTRGVSHLKSLDILLVSANPYRKEFDFNKSDFDMIKEYTDKMEDLLNEFKYELDKIKNRNIEG